MLWSYEKPTEPGLYMVNAGDTVTKDALTVVKLVSHTGEGALYDVADGFPVRGYPNSTKFRPVDYDYLNKIGNES